ncbi:hypothetical protein [Streptomyces sp. MST-110588]|uniref:hypothetical protein n=1 Tax=Streptomyces sp. MST-110588 TaxID=2833628 RepID=UPI001F5D51B1|nr:hypothetical protein [Streptomyces sp. MST-110588]UNO38678.1 hypothetical protein KGS77_02220 [Streptomyces sp. MST-110588]
MTIGEAFWSGLKEWVRPPDRHAVLREAKARAAALLPPGEVVVDGHTVEPGERVPEPPKPYRVDAFGIRPTVGDRVFNGVNRIDLVLDRLNPFNAAMDAWDRRNEDRSAQWYGGWPSAAGRLAAALRPRTEEKYLSVLLLTGTEMHVIRVQLSHDRKKVAGAVEHAYAVARQDITWLRDRKDVRHGTHEIGFADGSWVTVFFPLGRWGTLVEAFPHRLRHTDPIP